MAAALGSGFDVAGFEPATTLSGWLWLADWVRNPRKPLADAAGKGGAVFPAVTGPHAPAVFLAQSSDISACGLLVLHDHRFMWRASAHVSSFGFRHVSNAAAGADPCIVALLSSTVTGCLVSWLLPARSCHPQMTPCSTIAGLTRAHQPAHSLHWWMVLLKRERNL